MALTVEDGSVVAGADTYISITDADTYISDYLNSTTWTAQSTASKERFLRRATQYVDNRYGPDWRGIKIGTDQLLDWPRVNALIENYIFDSDAIPVQLKRAVSEVAVKLNDGVALTTDNEDGNIESESVTVGPIKVMTDYAGIREPLSIFPDIDLIIAPLLSRTDKAVRI